VPCPFYVSLIVLLFKVVSLFKIVSLFKSNKIQPLNYRGFILLRASLGFVVKFAFISSLSLSIINLLFDRPRVSSIYIAIILNRSLFINIRRQGSYIDNSINSFSL
jgi:hypothetical protein